MDNVKTDMNKNVNPNFKDNTLKFKDEDDVQKYLKKNRNNKINYKKSNH